MLDPRSLLPHLIREEGEVAWMYRDSAEAGNVTVGIGCLVASPEAACGLPFANLTEERSASADEIREDFARVMRLPRGLRASAYRATLPPAIELPERVVDDLVVGRINRECLPGLRRLLPGFDEFPDAAQIALADMIFNLGEGAPATATSKATGLHGFPSLLDSCRRGDFLGAASECHRKTCRAERNDWCRSQFLLAAT